MALLDGHMDGGVFLRSNRNGGRRPQCTGVDDRFQGPFLPDEEAFETRLGLLTAQQRMVLRLLAYGLMNKQIAHICAISEATVKSHVTDLLKRLGARSRTEAAVRFAILVERRDSSGERDGAERAVAAPALSPGIRSVG